VSNLDCADFGSNAGGFVDCLLQSGATHIYAVETGYGVLDWKLRTNPQVTVMERTNAMHVSLPKPVDFISIDTSWTKLEKVIPNALKNLKPTGHIVVLVKPHYEADPKLLTKGKLPDINIPQVLAEVKTKLEEIDIQIIGETESPLLGDKSKNKEFLLYLTPKNPQV
jgi:23S rRNA (cytidine1920-2'-O)/16S rRNA (cytidine1409-2'-O)-methyltransferase